MKKVILLFFAIIMMAIASCGSKKNNPSPDTDTPKGPDIEAPPAPEANTLPKKIVMHNGEKSESYTITYRSGSKKIDKITKSNGGVETYHYKGDLIERIDYSVDGNDYVKLEYDDDNKLIRETFYRSSNAVEKTEYTYPTDSKISIASSSYKDGKWVTEEPITLEFDNKGNVVKGGQDGLQATVSYNDKNTPFLNVTGWSKINFTGGIPLGDNVDISDIVGRRNNPTRTKVTDGGTSLLDLAFSYEFSDTDNAKFPTKITGKQSGQTVFTAEICYTGDCDILINDPDDPNNPGDEDQPNPTTEALPETIVMNSGGKTRTYTITYLGNTAKINKITATDERLETYIYEGDLISKKYEGTITSDSYDSYIYTDGKLTKEESYRGGKNTDITEFSYLSSTKVKVIFKEWNNTTWETGLHIQFNHDGKGNLIEAEMFEDGKPAGEATITYDDKNAPFVNVPSWRKIRYTGGAPLGDNIGFEDIMGTRNNPVKLTGNMMGENVEVNYTYEFKDSKNPEFPTKIMGTKKVGTGSETFTAEITYK